MTRRTGFTLVELLVVISLIGILSAVAIAVINPAKMMGKSRDARRRSDIKAIQGAIELYYSQNRSYPLSTNTFLTSGTLQDTNTPVNTFMTNVPRDPKTTSWEYCYTPAPTSCTTSCNSYLMCAGVEDVSNDNYATPCTGLSASRAGEYCVTNPF